MLKHTFQVLKSLYSEYYLFIALPFFYSFAKHLQSSQVPIFTE